MEPILKRELDKAIRVLDLIKCEYAIIDPDGQKYGNLEVAEKKIGKSRLEFPRGVVKEHIEPFIKDLMGHGVEDIQQGIQWMFQHLRSILPAEEKDFDFLFSDIPSTPFWNLLNLASSASNLFFIPSSFISISSIMPVILIVLVSTRYTAVFEE